MSAFFPQLDMLAGAPMKQRESKDQAKCPDHEKAEQRKRAEVAKERFSTGFAMDSFCQYPPRAPGVAVKPGSNPKPALDAAGQYRGLEGVEQHRNQNKYTENGVETLHVKLEAAANSNRFARGFLARSVELNATARKACRRR